MVLNGYEASIASILVQTLSILAVQKLGNERKTLTFYRQLNCFFVLALARLDFTRLYSAIETLIIING